MAFLNQNHKKGKSISKIIEILKSWLNLENLKKLRTRLYCKQRCVVLIIKKRKSIKLLEIFRNYSAFAVVASSAILVSATNISAGHGSSGFLFGYFGETDDVSSFEDPLKDRLFLKTAEKTNLAVAPLTEAKISPVAEINEEEDESEEEMIMQGEAFLAGSNPVRKDPQEGAGVFIYEVKSGDTVGSIAEAKGVSVNTIMWANEIEDLDSIMPGDKIFILPVSGLNYVVKKNDNLDDIANKYKADKEKIIAFNDIPANGEVKEGQELIIPGGEKEVPQRVNNSGSLGITSRPYESFDSVGKKLSGKAGTGHGFPYGYCTWYVSQRKYVPWSGNAGTWLYHAKSAGYATGKTPRTGSIMVSSESWWGHVAIVESVGSDTFTVSEMNYRGWAKKSTRTISKNSRAIKGFIYSE
ncbi:MAG: hypothetical protein COZ85_03405 [Candidatus Moranbacteria bacterium CG_4_8_14_3_um_filter_34_16]|nr:MAG: hypothetical protein COT31_00145 [Candidatus Moranbacteria bacterium CG08_land_8_20_14_0_20_34_16]PIW94786.1 MAG: hypothetical protein COZ85_03405 [Candidatus Moranbacteria bacterium CG_4_8_14_3_um_filter_34_16]